MAKPMLPSDAVDRDFRQTLYCHFREQCYAIYRMLVGHELTDVAKRTGLSESLAGQMLDCYGIQRARGVAVKRIEGFGCKTKRPIGLTHYERGGQFAEPSGDELCFQEWCKEFLK